MAEEVKCINAFDPGASVQRPPALWKPAAARWHNVGGISYRYAMIGFDLAWQVHIRELPLITLLDHTRLPINHLSPHAGLSVDVLYPVLQYTPVFCLTAERGFTLISAENGTLKPSIPIAVQLDRNLRRKLEDRSGDSDHPPSRYSAEVGPCFPGHDAFSAGLLRGIEPWLDIDGAMLAESRKDTKSAVHLQGDMLTAPAFTLKARRAQPPADEVAHASSASAGLHHPESVGTNMQYIYQSRQPATPGTQEAPILLSNPGGNQLFRAFLEGIGAVLPQQMRDALFDEPDEHDLQEYFYPISRCPLADDRVDPRPVSKPVLAASLEGLWVGCYSTHGYEFGIINVRKVWMPTGISSDGRGIIEQFYHDQRYQEDNADLSVNREPLAPNLVGSTKILRTIIELVKVTGDVNVPAGQVSWCAVLPRPFDDDSSSSSDESGEMVETVDEADILDIRDVSDIELPTVLRSDWEEWSNAPPHTAEQHHSLHNPPRWDVGSFEAAGRIAFTGFIDTRFIDAIATFVREDSGEVDEIRITWYVAAYCTFVRHLPSIG